MAQTQLAVIINNRLCVSCNQKSSIQKNSEIYISMYIYHLLFTLSSSCVLFLPFFMISPADFHVASHATHRLVEAVAQPILDPLGLVVVDGLQLHRASLRILRLPLLLLLLPCANGRRNSLVYNKQHGNRRIASEAQWGQKNKEINVSCIFTRVSAAIATTLNGSTGKIHGHWY